MFLYCAFYFIGNYAVNTKTMFLKVDLFVTLFDSQRRHGGFYGKYFTDRR